MCNTMRYVTLNVVATFILLCGYPATQTMAASYVVTNLDDNGAGSLRQMVTTANAALGSHTITFQSGLVGEVVLTSGEISVTGKITITGPGAALVAINGNAQSRVFNANSSAATIQGLTIKNGTGGEGSGIRNTAFLTLMNMVLSNNVSNSVIFNTGTLTVTNTTLVNNKCYYGAIYNTNKLTLTNSTIAGNRSDNNGGAIFNQAPGVVTAYNNTMYNNFAHNVGGAIFNQIGATTNLTNNTITANAAIVGGGGIYNEFDTSDPVNSGTVTVGNNIIVGNIANNVGSIGKNIYTGGTGLTTKGYNLLGENGVAGVAGLTLAATDKILGGTVSTAIAPLAGYGGSSMTMALLTGSPAVDAGDNAIIPTGVTTDQRGSPRIAGAKVDIGAVEGTAAPITPPTITVTNLNDAGPGSLRQAVEDANASLVDDNINFQTGLSGDIVLTQEIGITGRLTIDGPGAAVLAINADARGRIFNVDSTGVTIRDLTIKNGLSDYGAGIYNAGFLTLNYLTFSGNNAAWGYGGAIYNSGNLRVVYVSVAGNNTEYYGGGIFNKGQLTLSHSTIGGNRANYGAGIFNDRAAIVKAYNNTIYGNTARSYGGGVYNDAYDAIMDLTNNTIAANAAVIGGGGIYNSFVDGDPVYSGTMTLGNNIIMGNTGPIGKEIYTGGTGLVTRGYNLLGENGNSGIVGFTLAATDKVLAGATTNAAAPLANYGGSTMTLALVTNSPALDSGDNTLIPAGETFDQRGNPRIAGAKVDIGAVEGVATPITPPTITVTKLDDAGPGSLRQAVLDANASLVSDNINFQAGLTGEIPLTSGEIAILDRMIITGPGIAALAINGNGTRIFNVSSGGAIIQGLTIKNGSNGGVYNTAFLTLKNVVLTNHSNAVINEGVLTITYATLAQNTGYYGGAIHNKGTLLLTHSTIAKNRAEYEGGGIYNTYNGVSTAAITAYNNTIYDNMARNYGGGIYNAIGATLNLTNNTITQNFAMYGGGGIYNHFDTSDPVNSGTINLGNNIVAGNNAAAGQDIYTGGTGFTSQGYNLLGEKGSSGTAGLTPIATDKILTGTISTAIVPLANYGGSSMTLALVTGSPALDAGNNSFIPVGVTTDQRGSSRTTGTKVDIGAVEGTATPIITPAIMVTNLDDSGPGSLRQAVLDANASLPSNAINFQTSLTGDIVLTGEAITIADRLTINGPGVATLSVANSGGSQVFVGDSSAASILGLTIKNGYGDGAGIHNRGFLTLKNIELTGQTNCGAGAMHNSGLLVATYIQIYNNQCYMGGGIYNSGFLTLSHSTIAQNTAQATGGGITNDGYVTAYNNTIYGNTSNGDGGGIFNGLNATLNLTNITMAENAAVNNGGGIYNSFDGSDPINAGIVTLGNSVLIANRAAGGEEQNVLTAGSAFVTQGSNLFGQNGLSGVEGLTLAATDKVLAGTMDTAIMSLDNYGGTTVTHDLPVGSPAIDAGNNSLLPSGLNTDQRGPGFLRIVGSKVDMGAVEKSDGSVTKLLSITRSGSGSGVVVSNPSGISCGDVCSFSFPNSTNVALTTTPASNSVFGSFGGDADCNDGNVTMDANKTCTATFTRIYTITASAGSGGSVTPTGSVAVTQGTTKTFTVTANTGYNRNNAVGGTCPQGSWNGNAWTTAAITSDCTVSFSFTLKNYNITAIANPTAGGVVACTPNPVNHGSNSTCTATPSATYNFANFSGDCSGTTCTLTNVTGTKSVTANFVLKNYTLSLNKTGTGMGTITSTPTGINCGTDCAKPFTHGTTITLTATAAADSTFGGWNGANCTGIDTCTVNLTADESITANFETTIPSTCGKTWTTQTSGTT